MKKIVLLFFLGNILTIQSALTKIPNSEREHVFTTIFTAKSWGDYGTLSGIGSTLEQTKIIRDQLPLLFKRYNIQTVLDAPCGDLFWAHSMDLSGLKKYIGADIVVDMINTNKTKYINPVFEFVHLDIVNDQLPQTDLILCRDCLVHLTEDDIFKTIKNFKQSGATYLLVTTFSKLTYNKPNKTTGPWRPLNLEQPPFNFPKPLEYINEGCTLGGTIYSDKCLGLWKLSDL